MIDLSKAKALILAPHPDDEIFGCGGLIHRIKREGGQVYVLYITVGTTLDFSDKGISTAEERKRELAEVTDFLNIDDIDIALEGDEYHLQLDTTPQKVIVHAIERGNKLSLANLKPNIVISTSDFDYNQDHRAVFHATVTALRPASFKQKPYQPLFCTYELPYHAWNNAETLSSPSLYFKLTEDDIDKKIEALKLYKSQLKDPHNPLSIIGVKTLAQYRGLQCGGSYAESFWIKRLAVL